MRQKKAAVITGCILICMAGIAVFGFIRSDNLLRENNLWNRPSSVVPMPFHTTSLSQTVAEQYNIPDLTRSPSTERDLFLEKPGKAVKMGESIESEGFIFTVNSYMTTKKGLLKPFQYTDISWVKTDENRNILNDYSYFMVNITVENTYQEAREKYLSHCSLYCIKNDNRISDEDGRELFGYDGSEVETQSFYAYPFAPGEKRDFNLVYYIKDETIADLKLATLIINPGGAHPISPDVRFIDLIEE